MARVLHSILFVTAAALGSAPTAQGDPKGEPATAASTGGSTGGAKPKLKGRSKGKAKHGAAAANTDGPVATFPGFRILDNGASRVYVDLTSSVAVEEHAAPGTLTYTLKGARVLSKNNRNPLITTHFSSPVGRARLVPAGGNLELVIDLRGATTPTHRIVADPAGKSARLEVDFPAGNFPIDPARYIPVGGPHRASDRDDDAPPDIPRQKDVPGEADDPSGIGPKAP